jgi:ABC-2 type transport system permease protein
MDWRKFFLIIRRDVHSLLSDRSVLIIMYITPLALTFIISAAFSGFAGGGSVAGLKEVPIIVINQDQGQLGTALADTLLNPPAGFLADLLDGKAMTDVEAAKQLVRDGAARAVITIPADFSARLNTPQADYGTDKIRVEVFRDAGAGISGLVVRSVVAQLVNGFAAAAIGTGAAIQNNPLLLAQVQEIGPRIAQQLQNDPPLEVQTQQGTIVQDAQSSFNPIQAIAPGMAIFFLNFTLTFGVIGIMEERRNFTLQRMALTPTTRFTILAGKLGATYINGVIQLAILIVATSLMGRFVFNATTPIWGDNLFALALLALLTVAASIGLASIIVGFAKNVEQAQVIANALLILFGIAGGAFFNNADGSPVLGAASLLTLNHWAQNAIFQLQQNTFPLLNMVVLAAMAAATFGVGITLFSKKAAI